MNINLTINGLKIPVAIFKFSAGEVQVKLGQIPREVIEFPYKHVEVNCREYSSDGIMAILLLEDALRRNLGGASIIFDLCLPYLPYGRQDRACGKGEAFSLEVFLNMLKGWNIVTLDLHGKLPENVNVINAPLEGCLHVDDIVGLQNEEYTIVSADAGGVERAREMAYVLTPAGRDSFIRGQKVRCPETGQLTAFGYEGDVEGKKLLIVDDICDGGGTFIGLANQLFRGGAAQVDLLVTHGIFAHGVQVLFDNGFTNVYTTNSYSSVQPEGVKVLNVLGEDFVDEAYKW